MKPENLYRIEKRLQNGLNNYYIIREICSGGRKFSASHLIRKGTVPSRSEILRCAGMFGFDLEMKCIDKAAMYRAEKLRTDSEADEADLYELERFRLLQMFSDEFIVQREYFDEVADFDEISFTCDELKKMFESGKIPAGKTLSEVTCALNLRDAVLLRKKERVTCAGLKKLYAAIHVHEDKTLSDSDAESLLAAVSAFYARVRAGYHPLEQAAIFFEEFSGKVPDEKIFGREVFNRLVRPFGYRFAAGSFNDMVVFAREENVLLELDLRRFISAEFKVHSGARQRQLDFFGGK
ncbi:MAG TPA: hypothetical protein O0X39_01435 [Methanocorpusculum sp.]|nr:hypothetical protein [Methanocorpusculum sp.]